MHALFRVYTLHMRAATIQFVDPHCETATNHYLHCVYPPTPIEMNRVFSARLIYLYKSFAGIRVFVHLETTMARFGAPHVYTI